MRGCNPFPAYTETRPLSENIRSNTMSECVENMVNQGNASCSHMDTPAWTVVSFDAF